MPLRVAAQGVDVDALDRAPVNFVVPSVRPRPLVSPVDPTRRPVTGAGSCKSTIVSKSIELRESPFPALSPIGFGGGLEGSEAEAYLLAFAVCKS